MFKTHYDCPCLETCPLHYAMQIIGGKWKMQILCMLNNKGSMRYNTLKKRLDGISNTVLANALKELEQSGLIERTEYLEVPVRVEYSVTEKCDKLMPVLDAFSEWGEEMQKY
ncbi:MAG: helix-turn-helix domain-containing protein [Eubacteriaceae bacterium]|nr:helix-turn-helix domain-containing protein [Eubacteriaceae bacterium]